LSIWRILATSLCILTLTITAFAQDEPTDEILAPVEGEEVMVDETMVEEPVVEEPVVEEPTTEPAPSPIPTVVPTQAPTAAPACRLALGSLTPPDESLAGPVRALSGAWEGTLTGNPFWLVVERLSASDATIFYGQPMVAAQRAYEVRLTAQVRGDGGLSWNQPGVGMFQLTLASNGQRMTGDFFGVNGLLTNLSLGRCTLR
jgi:hypothetical protein